MEGNTYKFQKLTPIDDADLTLYKQALDFVFDNSDIRNVAISGAYGAGKSSVLKSYKKQSKKKFVHISLAHFEQPRKISSGIKQSNEKREQALVPQIDDEVKVKESVLEGKILNQLIHQIQPDKIPQTNFKVKKKVKSKSIATIVFSAMLILISIMHIQYFAAWNNYVLLLSDSILKKFLNIFTSPYSLILSGGICIIVLGMLLWQIIKAQKNKGLFRKLKFQGNEIEIFEESEDSYFDKYLNEVLYLFENANADVVVFEDMDRFNANRIFERLHEINTLANIQLEKENKCLRFFYLLRDDIFISKDRTKFFDFIIPIVPVVDSSNSYDQFIAHFKDGKILELFEESFLQGLSLYVDDMRILKNIYNEFIVYYNRLNITELDCNKMLGMITYKNIFPRDFSDLQLNQGIVYALFSKKDQFVEEEVATLDSLIEQAEAEIEQCKKEHLVAIRELDDAYSAKRGRIPSVYNNPKQHDELTKQYNEEYPIRKIAIENKINERLPELEANLSRLKKDKSRIENKPLKDIINRNNIDLVFQISVKNEVGREKTFTEIKDSDYFPLLKYLIWNGYIDETYADYMTYFYENSLTRIDKMFLRSVTDKRAKEYTYQLKKPALVISRLRLVDFEQEEILNFDLLSYLLQTSICKDNLTRLLLQLRDTKNFEFIGAFFDTERETKDYVKSLNSCWPQMFSYANNNGLLTEQQIRRYSIYTLYYSDKDSIQAVNGEGDLARYISGCSDYLDIDEPNIEKLIEAFILIGVSFGRINSNYSNAELFRAVYENSLYEINYDNISLMLKRFFEIKNESDIQHRGFTLIRLLPESPLSVHIESHLENYVQVALANSNGIIMDDEQDALYIMNHDEISSESCLEYVGQLKTKVQSIADVEDRNLWVHLLERDLVQYTAENIVEYFKTEELLDAILVNFINSEESAVDLKKTKEKHGDDMLKKFLRCAITCNELSNKKYSEILSSCGYYYENFSFEDISDEKMEIVIDQKVARMNLNSLIFVRKHYPEHVLYYIKRNIDEYVEIASKESFVLDEMLEILAWDIDDGIKLKLLGCTSTPISILDRGYSETVNEYILNNNLDSADLTNLFLTYDNWGDKVKEKIKILAIAGIANVINNSGKNAIQLQRTLFTSSSLTQTQKINLFIAELPNLEKDLCKEFLWLLDLREYEKIFETRSRPKYAITEVSTKLLTAFKKAGIIYQFEESEDKPGYYKIIRRQPINKSVETKLL